MLALLGYLRDPSVTRGPDEVRRQCSTYSEWKNPSDANPITYSELTPQLLAFLRGTGALFARKFKPDVVSADKWEAMVREAARANVAGNEASGSSLTSNQSNSSSGGGSSSNSSGDSNSSKTVDRPDIKEGDTNLPGIVEASEDKDEGPSSKRLKAI